MCLPNLNIALKFNWVWRELNNCEEQKEQENKYESDHKSIRCSFRNKYDEGLFLFVIVIENYKKVNSNCSSGNLENYEIELHDSEEGNREYSTLSSPP